MVVRYQSSAPSLVPPLMCSRDVALQTNQNRIQTLARVILALAALCACAGCGPSQDSFAEDFAAAWCPLAVECSDPSTPPQYDLSSVEACRADVQARLSSIDGGDNCSYDSGAAEDALSRVVGATCAEYEADANDLLSPSAFPCDHTVE
jgi:hypothetical protein